MRDRLVGVLLCLYLGSSCSGASATQPTLPSAARAASSAQRAANEPLTHSSQYVVAAGLKWLVLLDIPALLGHSTRVAPELLPKNNVESFERSLGVQVRQLQDVSVARYDYSTIYVARGVRDVNATSNRFAERMTLTPSKSAIGQTSLHTGVFNDDVEHYATLASDVVLWAEGDPATAKAALLLAQRRLRRSPSALNGAALSLLPKHCARGNIVALVPGPVDLPPGTNREASLVLAATLAFSLSASFDGDTLVSKICWLGDWQNDGTPRTKAVLDAVLNGRFAKLLELTSQERQGTFRQHDNLVEAEFRWAAAKVLTRLQAIVSLDLATLFAHTPQ